MESVILAVKHRNEIGKNKVKAQKEKGNIPGIVYGLGKENIAVSIPKSELMQSFKTNYGANIVIELTIESEKETINEKVIAYQIDMDPIRHEVRHVDFLRLDDKTPVKVSIPTQLVGNAPGVKMGGLLIKKMDFVKVKTLPSNIPTHFEVDISNLGLDSSFTVNDLNLSEDIIPLSLGKEIIVRIAGKRGKSTTETTEEEADSSESEDSTE